MLNRILFSIAVICAFILTSCNKEEALKVNDQINSEIPTEDAAEVDNTSKSRTLAHIQTDNVEYFFIENEGAIAYGQHYLSDLSAAEMELISKESENSTVLDLFLKVTDKQVAVPELIAATGNRDLIAAQGRKIDPTNANIELLNKNFDNQTAIRSCYDEGFTNFQNNRCQVPITQNDILLEFCDAGVWSSHIRNSYLNGWKRYYQTDTWTNVICGSVNMNYQYWRTDHWSTFFSKTMYNGIWHWIAYAPSHGGTVFQYLKVNRNKVSGNGFRAYTKFYNPQVP